MECSESAHIIKCAFLLVLCRRECAFSFIGDGMRTVPEGSVTVFILKFVARTFSLTGRCAWIY